METENEEVEYRSTHYLSGAELNSKERIARLRAFKEFAETAKSFRWRVE